MEEGNKHTHTPMDVYTTYELDLTTNLSVMTTTSIIIMIIILILQLSVRVCEQEVTGRHSTRAKNLLLSGEL